MNEPQVRPPKNGDEIQAMLEVRLVAAAKAYSVDDGVTPEDVRRELGRDNPRLYDSIESRRYDSLCMALGEKIIGMCVWDKGGSMNKLEYLYVLPEEQGKGYGSTMLDMALKDMGDKKPITLTTQDAQELYESRGFVATDDWRADRINVEQVMIKPASVAGEK